MKKYKLTTQNLTTHNGFQWEVGEPRTTSGDGELCGPGWLHYYHHPLLAILLNPMHADISDPILWEAEANGIHLDDHGLKGGCTQLTLTNRIELPTITLTNRVAFGILCAKTVCNDPAWNQWADDWISGKDRSAEAAARSAARSAAAAAWAAAWAAAAARSAARSAEAAARSAAIDLIAIAERAVTIT